jgi:hypothetical protein
MMVTIGGTGDRGPGTGENPGPESVARSTRALTTIQHALLLLLSGPRSPVPGPARGALQ